MCLGRKCIHTQAHCGYWYKQTQWWHELCLVQTRSLFLMTMRYSFHTCIEELSEFDDWFWGMNELINQWACEMWELAWFAISVVTCFGACLDTLLASKRQKYSLVNARENFGQDFATFQNEKWEAFRSLSICLSANSWLLTNHTYLVRLLERPCFEDLLFGQ